MVLLTPSHFSSSSSSYTSHFLSRSKSKSKPNRKSKSENLNLSFQKQNLYNLTTHHQNSSREYLLTPTPTFTSTTNSYFPPAEYGSGGGLIESQTSTHQRRTSLKPSTASQSLANYLDSRWNFTFTFSSSSSLKSAKSENSSVEDHRIDNTLSTTPAPAVGAYYLLAAATNAPLGGTGVKSSTKASRRKSAKMAEEIPSAANGYRHTIFGGPGEMGSVGQSVNERRRSFGIGGAGNIRKPSEVIYPTRERRKSSVWSTGTLSSSPDEKRGFMGWLGFGGGKK